MSDKAGIVARNLITALIFTAFSAIVLYLVAAVSSWDITPDLGGVYYIFLLGSALVWLGFACKIIESEFQELERDK